MGVLVTSGALSFKVRPVTSRTLLLGGKVRVLGGKLGFQGFDLCHEPRDRVGDRLVITR